MVMKFRQENIISAENLKNFQNQSNWPKILSISVEKNN